MIPSAPPTPRSSRDQIPARADVCRARARRALVAARGAVDADLVAVVAADRDVAVAASRVARAGGERRRASSGRVGSAVGSGRAAKAERAAVDAHELGLLA